MKFMKLAKGLFLKFHMIISLISYEMIICAEKT